MSAKKPQRKYGWPPGSPPTKEAETKEEKPYSWLDAMGARAIPKTKKVDRDKAKEDLKDADMSLSWAPDSTLVPERPERRPLGSPGRYPAGAPEILAFHKSSRRNPAPLPPDWLGGSGSLRIDLWQERKPLRSAWCNRANNALIKTGAHAAIPRGRAMACSNKTIVVE